ncbi:MAG: (Fe-S)-binding protein [Desulfobacteraceae bacterium]|jgi:NADPH-dependent glutamate synthase beta subunit-like oxidoreductase
MFDAIILMGGMGLVISIILAIASKVFYVYVDPKILAIEEELPGANCGGCGLPGCSANAEAIVAGLSAPNSCVAAGSEVAEAIASIMGVKVEAVEPDIALPGCYFGVEKADTKYLYNGLDDCRAVALLGGGMKVCTIGCLGLGTCARACPFDAISMGPEGLPVVNENKCTGCGTCERVCPKHIISLSSVTRRIIREYTTEECTTPCQRACPAGINIREYIRQISLGNNHRAVQVIKERNPFPAVIGRICPRPCELECRRNYIDEPVAINYLKRYAADYEKESGSRILPYKAPDTGRRIAVVGGGVQGLSAAFFAARLGHDATVFEATDRLGGLLRSAISKDRLPEEILDWDIEGIIEMGVKVETQKALGREFSIKSLFQEGFDAVFLASGGWDSRLARGAAVDIESPIPGTYMLVDLIRFGARQAETLLIASDVVIAGGGKLALDAAKISKERGATTVTVLFRESRENSPVSDEEVHKSGLTDVKVIYNAAINRLFGEADRLQQIEYIETDTDNKTVIAAQTLVFATGRFPELIFVRPKPEGEESEEAQGSELSPDLASRWEGIQPYKRAAFKDERGLFAEGDVLVDYSAAIKAIGAGRRAAASIHQVMHGLSPNLAEHVITPQSILQNVYHVEKVQASQRQIMPICSGKELAICGEIEKGFSAEMARQEAARCLQCGLICYEHTETAVSDEKEQTPSGAG